MFEISLFNVTVFGLSWLLIFYLVASLLFGSFIKIEFKKFFFYITIFSLFGVVGEIFVNVIYHNLTGSYLWMYHLYPVHDGHISKMFIFVWGSLGAYKYLSEVLLRKFGLISEYSGGLIMAAEAIFLELLYNTTFYYFFNDYIFYYFPDNLGPLSHFSCLQVMPFYFIFGYIVSRLISRQEQYGFSKTFFAFYWFITLTFVFVL